MEAEKAYHIGITSGHGAKYAILPGDPGRVEKIAKYLDNPKFLAQNREYTSYIGEISGEKVIVMSTGMGGPSAAIGVEELYKSGVETFVRIGTCGGMQTDIVAGDLIIATGAIRMEGTTKEYVPVEFPAVADLKVTNALVKAAENLNYKHFEGVVQSKDSFYGQHNPDRMPQSAELNAKWNAWIKAGCLASEMETAALFVVSSCLRARAGAVLLCVWNQEREKAGLSNKEVLDTESAIKTSVEAVKLLIEKDKTKV